MSENESEKSPTKIPTAERYYAASRAMTQAEIDVGCVLDRAFGGFGGRVDGVHVGGGWSDFSIDDYDESIEVFGVGLCDSAHVRAVLAEAGFALVWIHKPMCEPPRGNGCTCTSVRLAKRGNMDVTPPTTMHYCGHPGSPRTISESMTGPSNRPPPWCPLRALRSAERGWWRRDGND